MTTTTPAVFFDGPRQCSVRDQVLDWPLPGQVLVRSQLTLISTGTELTLYSGEFPEHSKWAGMARYPFTPGYANIGVVEDVGAGVDPDWLGTRVATRGRHSRLNVLGPDNLARVPDSIAGEEAAFFTLAQTVMNGVRRSRVGWGESVAVFGLGILGQLAVRFCRLCGARPVFGVDPAAKRRALLPADVGIQPVDASQGAEAVRQAIAAATRDRLVDCAFEVTGLPRTIPDSMSTVRRQGRFILLSSPRGKTKFDFHDLCNSPSYTIIGTHGGSHPPVATPDNPWTRERHTEFFFDLLLDGELDLSRLMTRKAHFSDAPAIYESLWEARTEELGVGFTWD
ncbi:MAG: zinc-binding alcohol dehydrogenase [Caldilineaceae bacterium]|nr:zinc-binding alcohol dehydrogenase [Caldilineaceae bacterium]